MRQLVEEQLQRQAADVDELKLRLSEEMDRVAFLERERSCHVEVCLVIII